MSATVMAPVLRATAPRARRDAHRQGATAREPLPPLHLTRRGRLVVWALGVALATGVGNAALSAQADGPASQAVQVQRIVVASGDTLWEIAADVAAPGEDVRDVVLQLMALNGLASGGLQAGQTIVVPVD